MDKLDDRNVESFGESVRNLVIFLPNEPANEVGKLIEGLYLRFQREAERDARDRANGKASD